MLSLAGAALETEIVRHLDTALGLGPDIISLSAGGTSRGDLPLLGFEMFWERYRKHKGTVLVAAARAQAVPGVGPVAGTEGSGLGGWRAEG